MRTERAPSRSQSSDVLSFLTEFARLLLAAGVTSNQFNEIAQLAFFRAASEDARFRNSRINQSTVAAMTGLNRTKIRALLRAEQRKSLTTSESRVDRLISAWISEAEFLESSGEPRRLRLSGNRGSYASLAKKHGSDVPPRALLRELTRRKLVKVVEGHVSLSPNAKGVRDAKRLQQVSIALASILEAPESANRRRALKVFTFEVRHPAPSAVGRILLQRRITKSLRAFLSELEAACNAVVLEAPQGHRISRMGKTSVLLLNQD